MKTRKVYITLQNGTYFVRYAERNKNSRHSAAQFYAPDTTLEKVQAWVRKQTNLQLVEAEEDTK